MRWIKWTGKALEFAGKVAQTDSFEEWIEGAGKATLEKLAKEGDHKLFKELRAKRELWGDLSGHFESSQAFTATVQAAINKYPTRFVDVVGKRYNLPGLPGASVAVVPRLIINDNERKFWQGFDSSQELANLKGGPVFRAFFFDEMVRQLDAAFSAAAQKSSPNSPLQVPARWIIGFDPNFEWNGSPGHYYVFTSYVHTSDTAEKKDRKAGMKKAAEEPPECQAWLGKLSDAERQKLYAQI